MYILGIYDGHDAGAALLEGSRILFAANEERYTRRKLEVRFPYGSIQAALRYAGLKPSDIDVVAFPTLELVKFTARVMPGEQEKYYMFRRRQMPKPAHEARYLIPKYGTTSLGIVPFSAMANRMLMSRRIGTLGFSNAKVVGIEHHNAHAATAAFTSGFRKALVVTSDGYGDGLSGTISIMDRGKLERISSTSARNSLGIFYEQATHIAGMRALEDEGKIMAMADYSFPFGYESNKLKSFFSIQGTDIRAKYGGIEQYRMLDRISWSMPREQFAYMVQQVLEENISRFVGNAADEHDIGNVAMAGGTFANVKVNMRISALKSVRKPYVFPHMGDGGIAMGAAMYANYTLNGIASYRFENAYLGESYQDERLKASLSKAKGLKYWKDPEPAGHAAELIANDDYVFWFQGRAEYGPRALGNRSILAKADSETAKGKLNVYVKHREWYQPFAPSILKEDSRKLLSGIKGDGNFMTMCYKVRPLGINALKAVIHIDNTARAQIVGEEAGIYRNLLKRVKRILGYGAVLNTSFNVHGSPIVNTPEEAIETMRNTGTRYMFMGNYFIEAKK